MLSFRNFSKSAFLGLRGGSLAVLWPVALALGAAESWLTGWGPLAALLVQLLISLVAALVMGQPTARRLAAMVLCLLGLGWPFFWPAEMSGLRALMTVVALLSVMRALDLATDGSSWDWRHRVWQMIGVVDIRELQRQAGGGHAWNWAHAIWGLFFLMGAVSMVSVALYVGQQEQHWVWPVRWLCGAAAMYCVPEASQYLIRFVYSGLGYETPPLHREPVLSCSIREFWGERWNLVVHRWLRRHFFWPLARRRRRSLGVVLAFVASASLHAWFIFAAVGWPLAGAMGAFFLLQGLLVVVESKLGWSSRSKGLPARAWALGGVLLPSPLFVEPALQVFSLRYPDFVPALCRLFSI